MLALGGYQVLRSGGIGGPPGPTLPPTGAVRVFAGGTVGLTGFSMVELTAAVEAIRKLILIGAVDPTMPACWAHPAAPRQRPYPSWAGRR